MTLQPTLIVLDLEATCDETEQLLPADQMEIIEIGAVILDKQLEISEQQFSEFVRPETNPKLTPFCTSLTHIEQASVDSAASFAEVFRRFKAFAGERVVLMGWGMWDWEQLERQAAAIGESLDGWQYINLKREFYRLRKMKEGSLRSAINRAGIEFEGEQHRALTDALNTAKLVPICGLAEYDPVWQLMTQFSGRTAIQMRPWLRAKNEMLGGLTPLHILLSLDGRRRAAAMLHQIRSQLTEAHENWPHKESLAKPRPAE